MRKRDYEGVFDGDELALIRSLARQAGVRRHELPDILQEIALDLVQSDEWSQAEPAERGGMLWVATRNAVSRITRKESRQRRRDEQKALLCDELYWDKAPLQLDVQDTVASLDSRCQEVCGYLVEGLSADAISRRMGCSWHTVTALIRKIRDRFEETGVDGWLE